MIKEVYYNNRVLSLQERVEYSRMADETIDNFSISINGLYQCKKEIELLPNSESNRISRIIIEVGFFIAFSFCDCVVLTKSFIMASNPYEKSFFRGKLKVQLNESFKKLYGFTEKSHSSSYSVKLETIMPYFPVFRDEYDDIMHDLKDIEKCDSWWKETRDIEVHIDVEQLYVSRNKTINESKVVMEAQRLIILYNRMSRLMVHMNREYIVCMMRHVKM